MNIASKRMIRVTALTCVGVLAMGAPRWSAGQTQPAQSPAPAGAADTSASHSSAQSEAGEPRARTSPDEPSTGSPEAGKAEAKAQPAGKAEAEPVGKVERTEKAGAGGKSTAADRVELKTATVTGDREQPKVMYIVPWKRSDIGDLSGKPMNSLLDEALEPIDRDEFKREVMYYQAVRADASQNGAPARGPKGAEAPPR